MKCTLYISDVLELEYPIVLRYLRENGIDTDRYEIFAGPAFT